MGRRGGFGGGRGGGRMGGGFGGRPGPRRGGMDPRPRGFGWGRRPVVYRRGGCLTFLLALVALVAIIIQFV